MLTPLPVRKVLRLMRDADNCYPFSVESLAYAMEAARDALPALFAEASEDLLRAMAAGLIAVAPHCGAAALLDFADQLHGVEEPRSGNRGDWGRWLEARRLRVRASEILNWNDPDMVAGTGAALHEVVQLRAELEAS